jgi:hypothetical protein
MSGRRKRINELRGRLMHEPLALVEHEEVKIKQVSATRLANVFSPAKAARVVRLALTVRAVRKAELANTVPRL